MVPSQWPPPEHIETRYYLPELDVGGGLDQKLSQAVTELRVRMMEMCWVQ